MARLDRRHRSSTGGISGPTDAGGSGLVQRLRSVLDRLALRCAALGADRRRWPVFGTAAGLGAVAILAMPPLHLLPALVVAFAPAIWLIEGAARHTTTRRVLGRAAWIGWAFGVGYFAAGTYWIGEAFLVDPARTGWLTPFAVLGVAVGLGLFPAAGFVLAAAAWRVFRLAAPGRVLAFAAAWVLTEWLRGWILTGFPWNLLGSVWVAVLPVAQTAALVGVYGLSLMTALAAGAPALLAATHRSTTGADSRRLGAVICLMLTVLLPLGAAGGGLLRMGLAAAADAGTVPPLRLRLVQANIDQNLKWQPELRLQHLAAHLDLSTGPGDGGRQPTLVIWPEAAVPFYLANDSEAATVAGRAVPDGGLLITGAIRLAGDLRDDPDIFNTVHVVTGEGAILATYDKTHLVPFGEYVPLRGILPFDRLVPSQGDLTAGPGLRTVRVRDLPSFSPLVCYEAIFPGAVTADDDRPDWLLNVTNDAWFGRSAGPYQHFAAARLRSIEEGLPLVRAANTGISAVVDPYGRVTASLGLGRSGVLDADLPAPLPATLFARIGNSGALSLIGLVAVLALIWRRPA